MHGVDEGPVRALPVTACRVLFPAGMQVARSPGMVYADDIVDGSGKLDAPLPPAEVSGPCGAVDGCSPELTTAAKASGGHPATLVRWTAPNGLEQPVGPVLRNRG